MTKPKPTPFTGHWRITSMPQYDENYLDEYVPAFIEFNAKGTGSFQFGYVSGNLNGKIGLRDGKQAIEFTWEDMDEMDECSGQGWVVLEGNELHGLIVFHSGDESEFVAKGLTKSRQRRNADAWTVTSVYLRGSS